TLRIQRRKTEIVARSQLIDESSYRGDERGPDARVQLSAQALSGFADDPLRHLYACGPADVRQKISTLCSHHQQHTILTGRRPHVPTTRHPYGIIVKVFVA